MDMYTLKLVNISHDYRTGMEDIQRCYEEINLIKNLANSKLKCLPEIKNYTYFDKQKIFVILLQHVEATLHQYIQSKQLQYH